MISNEDDTTPCAEIAGATQELGKLHFEKLTGGTMTLDVDLLETIGAVKKRVAATLGVPIFKIKLIHGAEDLPSDATLQKCKVALGSTLLMAVTSELAEDPADADFDAMYEASGGEWVGANSLRFRFASFGDNEFAAVTAPFYDPRVKELELVGMTLDDRAGETLAAALEQSRMLQRLNLNYNKLGENAGRALAGALKQNDVLGSLRLNYNKLGDDACVELAAALKVNKKLTTLCLRDNDLSFKAGDAIATALAENPRLETLYLDDNHIDEHSKNAIRTAWDHRGGELLL